MRFHAPITASLALPSGSSTRSAASARPTREMRSIVNRAHVRSPTATARWRQNAAARRILRRRAQLASSDLRPLPNPTWRKWFAARCKGRASIAQLRQRANAWSKGVAKRRVRCSRLRASCARKACARRQRKARALGMRWAASTPRRLSWARKSHDCHELSALDRLRARSLVSAARIGPRGPSVPSQRRNAPKIGERIRMCERSTCMRHAVHSKIQPRQC
mmetsp:Transcript_22008/g.66883  ORF Transcript_22008/g.66883 Transcript_22008/m.66883 type:complete len:220 (-) Transcript_22008:3042-3701(-)|eukprot:scaffold59238_cov27-Tisochrysis_lutea.AAC.3